MEAPEALEVVAVPGAEAEEGAAAGAGDVSQRAAWSEEIPRNVASIG